MLELEEAGGSEAVVPWLTGPGSPCRCECGGPGVGLGVEAGGQLV